MTKHRAFITLPTPLYRQKGDRSDQTDLRAWRRGSRRSFAVVFRTADTRRGELHYRGTRQFPSDPSKAIYIHHDQVCLLDVTPLEADAKFKPFRRTVTAGILAADLDNGYPLLDVGCARRNYTAAFRRIKTTAWDRVQNQTGEPDEPIDGEVLDQHTSKLSAMKSPAMPVSSLLALAKARRVFERPWVETTWEALVREYRRMMKTVENVNFHRLKAKIGSPGREALEHKLKLAEDRVQDLADECFALFGEILGVRGLVGYRKAFFDQSMEHCFGSLDKDGCGSFPLQTRNGVRCWPVDRDPEEANRMFSLYLARKVFCPVSTLKQEKTLASFYDNVCKAPTREVSEGMRTYFRTLVDLVFDKPDHDLRDSYFPTHASGCAEATVRQGGKRSYFYDLGNANFDRGKVTPVSIYTGGKVRVITTDSCWNLRYAFFNKFMAGKIRQARWCVFGQTVESWLEKNPDFLDLGDNEEYVSGDLESATDLLDGFFADCVIDRLGELFSCSTNEVEEMKSFTTHARLTDEKFYDERQKRGQLMGSVLSFPILCLVSFCFATYRTSLSNYVVKESVPAAKRRAAVMRCSMCGVNGDDVVCKDCDQGTRWAENVADGNGKVSRGKSPRSKFMFTVNSEIWFRDEEDTWHKPASIRPSLLAAIGDERRKNPSMEWLEYSRSELLSQEGKEAFSVARVLKPHVPKRLGGLGLFRKFDGLAFLEGWIARREVREATVRVRPKFVWGDHKLPYEDSKKVSVLVGEDVAKDVSELLYDTSLPQWTEVQGDPIEIAGRTAKRRWANATKSEIQFFKDTYERIMDEELSGKRWCKVPQEISRLFEIRTFGEPALGATKLTAGDASRMREELKAYERIGLTARIAAGEASSKGQPEWDDVLGVASRVERAGWLQQEREQELALEARRARNGLPRFLNIPTTFDRPISRVPLTVYRPGGPSGYVSEKPETKEAVNGENPDAIVYPAGYHLPRFSPPSTWLEDKERQEAAGYVRGQHCSGMDDYFV